SDHVGETPASSIARRRPGSRRSPLARVLLASPLECCCALRRAYGDDQRSCRRPAFGQRDTEVDGDTASKAWPETSTPPTSGHGRHLRANVRRRRTAARWWLATARALEAFARSEKAALAELAQEAARPLHLPSIDEVTA